MSSVKKSPINLSPYSDRKLKMSKQGRMKGRKDLPGDEEANMKGASVNSAIEPFFFIAEMEEGKEKGAEMRFVSTRRRRGKKENLQNSNASFLCTTRIKHGYFPNTDESSDDFNREALL